MTGVQFTYSFDNSFGNNITNVLVQDKPIIKDKYYKVVLNQLMLEGGHKYSSLKNAINIQKLSYKDMDYLKKWFELNQTIHPMIYGTINPKNKKDFNDKKCIFI